MPAIEREIKFRLPEGYDAARVRDAVSAAGYHLEPAPPIAHEDRYLDTDDWTLYRAGLALRIRSQGARQRLEAKSIRSTSAEALVRTEWTQEAPLGELPWETLEPGPVATLLAPLAAMGVPSRLRVRARIRNDRECFRWMDGEHELGSLTVDHVSALNGTDAPAVTFEEIEVEERPDAGDEEGAGAHGAEALTAVRRAVEEGLGLHANVASKLATALAAAGTATPERDERHFEIHPADRLIDVAHKTFARHFGRMLWNEPGTRLGVDAEYLHDMRVATRRLRSALEVFADAIPAERRDAFATELRWVGRALGRIRDRDVALEHVAALAEEAPELERPAWAVFARSIEIERARRRVRLIERLDSERYPAFVAAARAWVDAGPASPDSVPAGGAAAYATAARLAADRTREMAAAYEAAERSMANEDLHALRIAAKKARYAYEFFGDLAGPGAIKRAKRITSLQDFLGLHQDMITLLEWMRAYAKTVPHADKELTMATGSALGHLERAARVKRGDLHKAWDRVGLDGEVSG
ncbi:MAG: CHAD domain-containing protein [Hyphomicrobiales bacterium]